VDARVDIAVRSVLNLTRSPETLDHQDWDIIESLRRAFARYRPTQIEFHGVRNSVPDALIVNPRSVSGVPAYCVFTERHYSMVAAFRTLAVRKFPRRMSRTQAAHNLFLRLAADYLLQQGRHGDAARLYCASWLTPAGDALLALDAGILETFLTNPMLESVLVEGGWPLAHELGHILADSDAEVSSLLADLLARYIQDRFGDRAPAWGPPGAREKLLAEISADWFGAELLLRSIGGRRLDQDRLWVLLSEFAANMWIMMLMESCKEVVRLVCTAPDAVESVLEQAAGHSGWMYDVRNQLLFHSIRADLHEALGSTEARTRFERMTRVSMDIYRPNFEAILAGLWQAQRTMLDGPPLTYSLLQDVQPQGVGFWDPMFRRGASGWVRSPMFQDVTREFVNRVRATRNFRDQPVDLIDHLDRLVPDNISQVTRRRLRSKEIDKSGIAPPEYPRSRRLPPLGNLITRLRDR
jgi:hypothetical protein